jgi:hypothetical protein
MYTSHWPVVPKNSKRTLSFKAKPISSIFTCNKDHNRQKRKTSTKLLKDFIRSILVKFKEPNQITSFIIKKELYLEHVCWNILLTILGTILIHQNQQLKNSLSFGKILTKEKSMGSSGMSKQQKKTSRFL